MVSIAVLLSATGDGPYIFAALSDSHILPGYSFRRGFCPQLGGLPSIKVAALTFHAYMAHFIMSATGDGPSIRCFPCIYTVFH